MLRTQLSHLILLIFCTTHVMPLNTAGKNAVAGFTDILEPLLYFVEFKVAAKQIPKVAGIAGRKTLKDCIKSESSTPLSFDHSKWDSVLKRHVSVGTGTIGGISDVNLVDYAGISNDSDFTDYLQLLEAADPTKLSSAEQLAFWMNAYNALCINIIIEYEKNNNVKIESINDLSTGKDTPVWDQIAGKVAGKDISLNNIEHDKLRKVWDEPMVHACIVCASASCPNLRPEAFVVDTLEEQMIDQTKNWLQNESKGLRLTGKKKLELSRIFLWFKEDFGKREGIESFLPKYLEDEKVKDKISHGNINLRHFKYSWKINRA